MGNIRFTGLLNSSILCVVATSFIASTIASPLDATYEYEAQTTAVDININFNDIAFIARIEKLYEKAKKYIDKLESGKLIEVMFDIKMEVEGYTGKKIDIESKIDQIEREAKNGGAQFKREEMKAIRNLIKRSGNKHTHKSVYLYECNICGIEFNQYECNLHYKSSHKHDKEEKEEVKVPIRMTIGVTASLCGYFLSFIPHPYCQGASKFLIAIGIEMCIESTVSRIEENEEDKKGINLSSL